MKLTNEFDPIRKWAEERGIFNQGDIKTQALKMVEEVGELAKAIINNDEFETIDALGDVTVVAVNLSKLAAQHFNNPSITLESCVNTAYEVIANRKGAMENGSFKKDR